MNGRERILALLDGRPPDRLPLMPITMMFAADRIGAQYRDYATDYRVLAEAQIRTAEEFDFDYVSTISDPAREAADWARTSSASTTSRPPSIESDALLATRPRWRGCSPPDPARRRPHARPREGGGPVEGARRPGEADRGLDRRPLRRRRPTCAASTR